MNSIKPLYTYLNEMDFEKRTARHAKHFGLNTQLYREFVFGFMLRLYEQITDTQLVCGEWIEPDESDITTACICSLCDWRGHIMEDDVMGMPYCPNCGAKMKGNE